MIYCLDLHGSPWWKMSHKTHVEWVPPSLHAPGSCFWNKWSSCPVQSHEYMLAVNESSVEFAVSFLSVWPLTVAPLQHSSVSSHLFPNSLPTWLPIWCLIDSSINIWHISFSFPAPQSSSSPVSPSAGSETTPNGILQILFRSPCMP